MGFLGKRKEVWGVGGQSPTQRDSGAGSLEFRHVHPEWREAREKATVETDERV